MRQWTNYRPRFRPDVAIQEERSYWIGMCNYQKRGAVKSAQIFKIIWIWDITCIEIHLCLCNYRAALNRTRVQGEMRSGQIFDILAYYVVSICKPRHITLLQLSSIQSRSRYQRIHFYFCRYRIRNGYLNLPMKHWHCRLNLVLSWPSPTLL